MHSVPSSWSIVIQIDYYVYFFFLQVIVLPVLTACHPDLSHVSVHRRRPEGHPGCHSEQRDLLLCLQPIAACLSGQLQYRAGIC